MGAVDSLRDGVQRRRNSNGGLVGAGGVGNAPQRVPVEKGMEVSGDLAQPIDSAVGYADARQLVDDGGEAAQPSEAGLRHPGERRVNNPPVPPAIAAEPG